MIKLVCFDLDGTLIDSTDWHYKSFNAAMKQVTETDYVTQKEHSAQFNGIPTVKKVEMLLAQGRIRADQAQEIAQLKSDFFQTLVRSYMRPDPEKLDVMVQLKEKGFKIAVVSNCTRVNTELLLSKLGIIESVDYIVSASDVMEPKPSPQGYIKAMDEFGALHEETLIFEDSPVGLVAARASNAHVVEVTNATEITSLFVMLHVSLASREIS